MLAKILSITFAILLAVVWMTIGIARSWNLFGSAGVAVGLLTAIPLGISNRSDRHFRYGLLAAAIAVAAIGIGVLQSNHQRRERLHSAITDDKSFIAAMAEQKMMRQSPAFGGKTGAVEGYPAGIPLIVDSRPIPENILKEAAA
jgi:hypothetical protein